MKNYFSSDFKLGVLGGGQLGRMLLAETQKYDIFTSILDGNENAPCAQIC
ncbi:MAG: 5-(carboxyamino)imidazole ribonucleotide synthase, partial [Polaribacter sp.]